MRLTHVRALFLATLASTFLVGCSGSSGNGRNGNNQLIPAIEATRAQYGELPLIERLSGAVKARNQVEIYPEISAVIMAVDGQNGDDVTAGQPLVSLRDREFQERLNQAKAARQIAEAQARQSEAKVKEVRAELGRSKALYEKGLMSDAEFQSVETKALSAEADLELAQARVNQARATEAERKEALAQTVIRAPVSGTIGNRNAEVGMTVSPGTRLFTLGQLDTVQVQVILTDRMLEYIEAGQRAGILADNLPGGELTASLSRISPFLHPQTHSTEGEIDLANKDHALKSGMFVTVDINYGESEQATLVPLSALYDNPLSGVTGVYISRDTANRIMSEASGTNKDGGLSEPVPFEFVPVQIIAKGRMSAGVKGIEPGTWVVTIGQDLFGGEPGEAKVRPVDWTWVEQLQNLQSEDLLEDVVRKQQTKETEGAAAGS